MDPSSLKARYETIIGKVTSSYYVNPSVIDLWYNNFVASWTSPGRFYHTLEHLSACLEEFYPVKELAKDKSLVEFALWYHDFIYIVGNKDNEEKSGKAAKYYYWDAGVYHKNLLLKYILSTKDHLNPIDDDNALLMDIDLSILGKSEHVYNEYAANIRCEWYKFSNEEYSKGRIAFLKKFLERPAIYHTRYFQTKYELCSRRNIRNEIITLEKRLT